MTTIDGHTIYINDPEIESIQNTVSISIAGTDFSHIDHLGYDGLVITLNGHETTRDAYNLTMSYLMSEEEMTLVLDTGYAYKVHNVNKTYVRANESIGNYPYSITMVTHDPYTYGASTITRSKTITTADQEWSQDDSTNDISTGGNVDAKPDLKVTGGAGGPGYKRVISTQDETDPTTFSNSTSIYVLKKTVTLAALEGVVYNLNYVSGTHYVSAATSAMKITYQAASLNGGAETTIIDILNNTGAWRTDSATIDITSAVNETLTIRYYVKVSTGGTSYLKDCRYKSENRKLSTVEDISVYNVSDDSVVSGIANVVFQDEIVRLNSDGTGHIDYSDDFTTVQYVDDSNDMVGISIDAINDELDIADDGYIVYKIDAKYPILSIPILTAQINITSGTPTIQVANDVAGLPGTWYDLDIAIVDNVSTEYKLRSGTDVVFDGQTVLWFRFDCVKTAAATCSIIEFDLDVDIITIDALIPIINKGGAANTFKCVQSSDSSIDCTVDLIYNDRWWA